MSLSIYGKIHLRVYDVALKYMMNKIQDPSRYDRIFHRCELSYKIVRASLVNRIIYINYNSVTLLVHFQTLIIYNTKNYVECSISIIILLLINAGIQPLFEKEIYNSRIERTSFQLILIFLLFQVQYFFIKYNSIGINIDVAGLNVQLPISSPKFMTNIEKD